jgi:hypothetical protein
LSSLGKSVPLSTPYDTPILSLFNGVADSAISHAGQGVVLEADEHPSFEFLYTETHLALLLFLLNRAGVRPDGLSEAADRLRAWDRLGMPPTFFNSMAIALLGIEMRRNGVLHPELTDAIAAILARRRDFAEAAWARACGNNMYVQQLLTDLLLAPLAEGRATAVDANLKLGLAFSSCMGEESYFFDLPRPGIATQREFPFTYNLKFLFLLTLSQHYLCDGLLERRLRAGLTATLPLFTQDGDCSYFGRTDKTTFAAGLGAFCLRAAASMNVGGESVCRLVTNADALFSRFSIGNDGCFEVNRNSAATSKLDRDLSRDDYAYRWQYAVAGAAYCLLGRLLFGAQVDSSPQILEQRREVFSSVELGIVRAKLPNMDLFIRTGSNLAAKDRRHAGPTILRLEHGGRVLTGTIPVTVSSDSRVVVSQGRRSVLARHFDLLRYRWQHGFEELQWELAGFIPVLRHRHRAWIPMQPREQRLDENRLVTIHPFRTVYSAGWVPAWNHFANLASIHVPSSLRSVFREFPTSGEVTDIQLIRTISWTTDKVSIADQIAGDIVGKNLLIGTRFLESCGVFVVGLNPKKRLRSWGSEGMHELQLYGTRCSTGNCSYEITIMGRDH